MSPLEIISTTQAGALTNLKPSRLVYPDDVKLNLIFDEEDLPNKTTERSRIEGVSHTDDSGNTTGKVGIYRESGRHRIRVGPVKLFFKPRETVEAEEIELLAGEPIILEIGPFPVLEVKVIQKEKKRREEKKKIDLFKC